MLPFLEPRRHCEGLKQYTYRYGIELLAAVIANSVSAANSGQMSSERARHVMANVEKPENMHDVFFRGHNIKFSSIKYSLLVLVELSIWKIITYAKVHVMYRLQHVIS